MGTAPQAAAADDSAIEGAAATVVHVCVFIGGGQVALTVWCRVDARRNLHKWGDEDKAIGD